MTLHTFKQVWIQAGDFNLFKPQLVSRVVKATQEALQHSYREVQMLQKHRDKLQRQLGDIAMKINSGMIPDPEDLELPDMQSEGAFNWIGLPYS